MDVVPERHASGWWKGGRIKWTEERKARLKELYSQDNRLDTVVQGMRESFPEEDWQGPLIKSQAQRMGISHRRNFKAGPFSQRISIITTPSTNRALNHEAAQRGMSKSRLVAALLAVIVKDDLFNAVIGETNGYAETGD